jgi:LacI family transcriptional regulator
MATLKDIADRAGLSIPTVSRILNPASKSRIHARKLNIKRVKEIAESLSYTPNAAARALATKRTGNIGFVLDIRRNTDEENMFWSPILNAMVTTCKSHDVNCMVSFENYENLDGFTLPRKLREKNVDGIILSHPLGNCDSEVLEKYVETGVPLVVVSAALRDARIGSVSSNPNPGYRKSLLHLVERGHKRVGYCIYPEWNVIERRDYLWPSQETLQEFDIEYFPVVVDLSRNTHEQEGLRIAEEIISGKLPVTAIIMGDMISAAMMSRFSEEHLLVPKDISVIGLDDTMICKYTSPQLTSLSTPLQEMGSMAIELLFEMIRAKNAGLRLSARHATVNRGFVIRASTGPAQRQ